MTDMPPPSRRSWRPRFSLRMLMMAVVIVAMPLGWVAYSLNWIRQRHAAIDGQLVLYRSGHGMCATGEYAPGGLWLFGEEPLLAANVRPEFVERARQLFPEAKLTSIP